MTLAQDETTASGRSDATLSDEFEERLCEFEKAWLNGDRPSIGSFVTDRSLGTEAASRCAEFVAIDLEFRWRFAAGAGCGDLPVRPRVEDYLARWACLDCPDGRLVWLIGEEYRVRRLWGDRPCPSELLARFPAQASELTPLLKAIGAEVGREESTAASSTWSSRPTQAVGVGTGPAPFLKIPGVEILDVVGRGGMGIVYKARQVRLNRLVAVKTVLTGAYATDQERVRFRLEAESAARIRHPNIAQIHEVGEVGDQVYHVLEFVDGMTLRQAIDGVSLRADSAARLVEVLSRAIHVAHQCGVVHRDLKPSNVLIPRSALALEHAPQSVAGCWDMLKIVDFGLAKRVGTTLSVERGYDAATVSGALLGTPGYMAPEQAAAQALVGPAVDIHALGAILYELLVGYPPFRGDSLADTLEQLRSTDPAPPRRFNPAVPRDLETICLKCLHKDPSRRYDTALDLADDLKRFQAREPICARPVTRGERLWLWARRRPALAALMVSCAFLVLAVFAGGIYYNLSLRAALRLAATRGRQAEQNFSDAIETVRRSLVILGNERLAPVPEVEDARRDALDSAAVMLERLAERRSIREPALDHELARTHMGIGRIQLLLGHHDQAERSFRLALAILESLAARPAIDRSLDRDVADVETLIAKSLGAALAPATVREQHFDRAISLLDTLARGDSAAKVKLAAAHDAAGTIEGSINRLNHASRAVEIYNELAAADPSSYQYQTGLARALFNLATVKREEGPALESEAALRRCLKIWDSISIDRLDDVDRRGLAECLHTLGLQLLERAMVENNRDIPTEAVELVRRGLKVHEQLVLRQPRVYVFRDGLSRAYNGFGIALGQAGRYQEAVAAFQSAEATREAVIQDFPERLDERFFLAEVLVNKATYEGALRNAKQCIDAFGRAIKLLEAHTTVRPQWARVHNALAKAYQNLAIQMRAAGRLQEAIRLHDRSIASFETAARLPKDSSFDRLHGVFLHAARAQTWAELRQFDRAAADWERAADLSVADDRGSFIAMQALALANGGEYQRVSSVLNGLAAASHIDVETHYNAACAYSKALRAVDRDSRLDTVRKKNWRAEFFDAAMKHLAVARAAGLFSDPAMIADFRADADLEALRPEPRFAEFNRSLQPATQRPQAPGVNHARPDR